MNVGDEEFLERASVYITDGEIRAAHAMQEDSTLSVDKACAGRFDTRRNVVMALQGLLKEAVVRNGRISPGTDYVDPFEVAAVLDENDVRQMAAWAIYRTVEQRRAPPLIVRRGARVH